MSKINFEMLVNNPSDIDKVLILQTLINKYMEDIRYRKANNLIDEELEHGLIYGLQNISIELIDMKEAIMASI